MNIKIVAAAATGTVQTMFFSLLLVSDTTSLLHWVWLMIISTLPTDDRDLDER